MGSDGFKHKWSRTIDLNTKFDPTRVGLDPVEPFQGMSRNGFTVPLSQTPKRTPSAHCKQPDRSFIVLGTSQHGPEMLECGSMVCVNWGIYKQESAFPNMIIAEYVRYASALKMIIAIYVRYSSVPMSGTLLLFEQPQVCANSLSAH